MQCKNKKGGLHFSRLKGERIEINTPDGLVVIDFHSSAKITVSAPPTIRIWRGEIVDRWDDEKILQNRAKK